MNSLDKGSTSLLICSLAAVIFTFICLAICVYRKNRCRKTKDKDKYEDQKMQNLYEDQKMQNLHETRKCKTSMMTRKKNLCEDQKMQNINEDKKMQNCQGLAYADLVLKETKGFQNRSRDQLVDSSATIMNEYEEANVKPVAWAPSPPPPPPDPPNPHS